MLYGKEINKNELLEEYRTLREELIFYEKNSNNLFNYSLGSFGVLLSLAINRPNVPLIYSIILFVLLVISMRRKKINNTTNDIAAYMKVFFEPYLDIKRETSLSFYRSNANRYRSFFTEICREPLLLGILSIFIMVLSYRGEILKGYLLLFAINIIILIIICILTIDNFSYNINDKVKKIELKYMKIFKCNNIKVQCTTNKVPREMKDYKKGEKIVMFHVSGNDIGNKLKEKISSRSIEKGFEVRFCDVCAQCRLKDNDTPE